MTSPGRPKTLVKQAFEHWPIELVHMLPSDLRGLYVLYDPDEIPVRVGISGRGKKKYVRSRIKDYLRNKRWRHVDTFSVYTFHERPLFKQAEVLLLRAVGKALRGNIQAGRFPHAKTETVPPPRRVTPRNFLATVVRSDGTIKIDRKHGGKRVRVDVGARPR